MMPTISELKNKDLLMTRGKLHEFCTEDMAQRSLIDKVKIQSGFTTQWTEKEKKSAELHTKNLQNSETTKGESQYSKGTLCSNRKKQQLLLPKFV